MSHLTLTRSLTVGVLAAAALGGSAASAGAAVRDCDTDVVPGRNTISSARGMSCATAAKTMKAYQGEISRTFKVKGFTCTRQSGGQFGGQWRCASGRKAFRFEFRD